MDLDLTNHEYISNTLVNVFQKTGVLGCGSRAAAMRSTRTHPILEAIGAIVINVDLEDVNC